MTPNKVIALTGGIGSGKSYFCSLLEKLGYETVDCDAIARQVSYDGGVLKKIEQTFGKQFVLEGVLDRRALRDEVFGSEQKKKALDDIFFTRTVEALKERLKNCASNTVFVEVSNFKEEMQDLFTLVFEINAAEDIRLDRVTMRDNADQEGIKNIMAMQKPPFKVDEKIVNEGNYNSLLSKAKALIKKYNL